MNFMKKTKFVGLLTLVLALGGLVGCGGKKDTSSAKHTHNYVVDSAQSVAATCEADGKEVKVCSGCGDKKETTKKATGHKWVDDEDQTGVTLPTCTEAGQKKQHCTNPGCTKTQTINVEALGHDYKVATDQTGAVAPTCEDAGTEITECSRCHAKSTNEVQALGHEMVKDADDPRNVAPTCTEAGKEVSKCSRQGCNHEVVADVAALGHDIKLVDADAPVVPGKATVRMYSCTRNCGTTYFGFKANEVSEASKSHLVINDQGGARFWGRPIGNKMELDDEGSATARPGDLTAIFDETETGDFFEYVFDLTEEQVSKIGDECLLYCEAQPANYLGGQDFWACDPSAEEWTPGLYIEGEKKGQPIEDYRYILYVDDKPVEFDSTMKAPVANGAMTNLPIGEYVMPYKFHLHKGTNKISLRMAGGYRSVFYNFTFRAVEEEEPVTPPTPVVHTHEFTFGAAGEAAQGEVAYAVGTCKGCGKEAIKILSGADMNGKLKQDDKLPKGTNGYDGTAIAKYVFSATAGAGELYVEAAHDNAGNDARSFYDGKVGNSNSFPLPDGKTNTVMKMNGEEITLPTATYGELGLPATANQFALIKIADVTLAASNEFTMTATSSYGLKYKSIIFVTSKAHAHTYAAGSEVAESGKSTYTVDTCACGGQRVMLNVVDLDGQITKKGGKLGANDATARYAFDLKGAQAALAGKSATLWVKGTVDNAGNYNYGFFTGKNGGKSPVTLPDGKTNTTFKLGETEIPAPVDKTYKELGMTGTDEAGAATFAIGACTLAAENVLTITRNDSYGIQYYEIFFVVEA